MHQSKLTAALLALTLSGSVLLAGCGVGKPTPPPAGAPAPAPQQPATTSFTDVTIGEAKILNPILTADAASDQITSYVFDSLVAIDDKLHVINRLAENHQVSKDGLHYTFKLRQGVQWHDGRPFTPEDVTFTFNAIMHPQYTGVRQSLYDALKGAPAYLKRVETLKADLEAKKIDQAAFEQQSAKAWEDWQQGGAIHAEGDTVTFSLEKPYAPFLTTSLTMSIIPAHIFRDALGAKMAEHRASREPIGTGRYKFAEWAKGSHVKLVKNPDWFGGAAKIDTLIIKVIPDQQAAMVALETAQAQRSGIMPDAVERFKRLQHVNLHEWMAFNYTYLGYNLKNPLFADQRVRQALTHAINRQAVVDQLLLGHGSLANTHSSPVRWDYSKDVANLAFDPAKARDLLAAAGWKPGPDGILAKDGRRFSFTLATNNGNKLRENAAVIIQQDLAKVGIEAKPSLMEWSKFVGDLQDKKLEGYILGWSMGLDPDDAFEIFHTKGGLNSQGYSNSRVDALIEQGRATVAEDQRKPIYAQIQKLLVEDQPYTWLYYGHSIYGLNKKIGGPIAGTPAGLDWNIEKWTVNAQP